MLIEIVADKKWKYRLPEDETFIFEELTVSSSVDTPYITAVGSVFLVKKGYAWDGSSIPLKRIIKFISFGFWDLDRYCKKASCHHDIFYQLMRLGLMSRLYKDRVDEIYKKECIVDGMSEWEANVRFWCLQKFGNVEIKEKPIVIIEV